MRIRTKQRLLATLREDFAYSGNGTLEDVLKYLKDEAIKIDEEAVKALFNKSAALEFDAAEDETEDVEEVTPVAAKTKTKAKAKTAVADEEDEGEGEDIIDIRARREERVKSDQGNRDKHARSNKTFTSNDSYAAKAYNAKAASMQAAFGDADQMTAFNAAMRIRCYELFQKDYPSVFKEYTAKGFLEEDEAILINKTASDTIGTLGGFLLANTLKSETLWATEEWGVARYIARNEVMVGNNTSFSRKTAIPAFKPLSSGAAQTGDQTFDLITLIPKAGALLILTPMVLFEQSAVNLGDTIAETFMEAYWNSVDDCLFIGDGSATYFNQIGLSKGLTGTAGSTTSGSYFTASANTMASWTSADYVNAMGRINNANWGRCIWVMSRQSYIAGPLRLATQATTGMTLDVLLGKENTFLLPSQQRGPAPAGPQAMLLGRPVFFSQRMSTATTTANTILAYFGDFVTGTIVGHRTQLEIASSEHYAFDKRALATRGFAEFAVNICGDGRATSTQCGPITAVQTST